MKYYQAKIQVNGQTTIEGTFETSKDEALKSLMALLGGVLRNNEELVIFSSHV